MKLIIVYILFSLCGCTPAVPLTEDNNNLQLDRKNTLPNAKGWWFARFRVNWPEGKEPNWFMGPLLAGEVIAPVLKKYRSEIDVWRFHRRASRDGNGHIFSFIFFSSPQFAQSIYNAIERDPLLIKFRQEKKIISAGFDSLHNLAKTGIADTSDRQWPEAVRKSWPVFIMGASQMWLDMVTELAIKQNAEQNKEIIYQDVQKQITKIWMDYGQHAWLHHLSGLYAYQPIFMRY